MPTLHVLCGLPLAGKTTLAKKLEAEHRAIRLTPDEWMLALGIDLFDEPMRARVESLQWQLAERALKLGFDVVLDWGVWSREERERIRLRAGELGARSVLYYLRIGLDEQKRRLAERNPEWAAPGSPYREGMLEEWAGLFEPPLADELEAS